MKNKKKIIQTFLLTAFLILVVAGGYLGYKELYLPMQEEYTAKIYTDNNTFLEDVTFKKGSYLQVLNNENEIEKELELTKDMDKLNLENAQDTDELMFDSWELTRRIEESDKFYKPNIIYYEVQPIYQEQEDYILTFITDEKAILLSEEENEVRYIRKPYSVDKDLTNYLPEIRLDQDYKGDWLVQDTEEIISKETEITSDLVLMFQSYQDKNDNEIDDFTEEFTIDFVSNLEQEVESVIAKWAETIELPILTDKNFVFYDWYIDEDFEVKFTENTKVTDNLTLYAKVKSMEEAINRSVEDVFYREDIAIQIESYLKNRNQIIDRNYNEEIKMIEAEKEAVKQYNEENNITTQEQEQVIELHNANKNKIYLIKFLDKKGDYIYSFVAPYGQTIKILTENGKLHKEIGVRNFSTIVLEESKLLDNSSELDVFHSEYRQINEMIFVKIQPIGK